ncbi:hypothetical protein, partial [Bifidobacterium adolescentis]|uniref:hypothetical protein n=1 Tax=Bifidobacterium adolescentis TaxID=1680 RepID=UPI00321C282D
MAVSLATDNRLLESFNQPQKLGGSMSVRDDQLDTLKVGGKDYDFYRIADLPGIDHLPYSLKVLVENLVRNIDGANITDDHVKA